MTGKDQQRATMKTIVVIAVDHEAIPTDRTETDIPGMFPGVTPLLQLQNGKWDALSHQMTIDTSINPRHQRAEYDLVQPSMIGLVYGMRAGTDRITTTSRILPSIPQTQDTERKGIMMNRRKRSRFWGAYRQLQ